MRAELVVFAVLLGCVLGGPRTPARGRGDDEGPTRPVRPDGPDGPGPGEPGPPSGPPIGPPSAPICPPGPGSICGVGTIRPWPIKPATGCHTQTGGWSYEALPVNKWPTSGNGNVFYVGCKVWRPTWSSCSGTCKSSHNITLVGTGSRDSSDCKCCKSTVSCRVRPYPKCWVVRIDHGQFLSATFETVRQRVDYLYPVAARCSCGTCARGPSSTAGSGPRGPQGRTPVVYLAEDDVTGRPAPPTPSSAERDEELGGVAGTIPGLRGALARGSLEA